MNPFPWRTVTSQDFGRMNKWSKARGNPVAEKIKLKIKERNSRNDFQPTKT